jgi:hypothetical protein
MKRFAAICMAAATLALGACDDDSRDLVGPSTGDTAFEFGDLQVLDDNSPSLAGARLEQDGNVVRLIGVLHLPNPCYSVDGDWNYDAAARTLNLTVLADPDAGECDDDTPINVGYLGVAARLPAGSYTVSLNNDFVGQPGDATVLNETVDVQ